MDPISPTPIYICNTLLYWITHHSFNTTWYQSLVGNPSHHRKTQSPPSHRRPLPVAARRPSSHRKRPKSRWKFLICPVYRPAMLQAVSSTFPAAVQPSGAPPGPLLALLHCRMTWFDGSSVFSKASDGPCSHHRLSNSMLLLVSVKYPCFHRTISVCSKFQWF